MKLLVGYCHIFWIWIWSSSLAFITVQYLDWFIVFESYTRYMCNDLRITFKLFAHELTIIDCCFAISEFWPVTTDRSWSIPTDLQVRKATSIVTITFTNPVFENDVIWYTREATRSLFRVLHLFFFSDSTEEKDLLIVFFWIETRSAPCYDNSQCHDTFKSVIGLLKKCSPSSGLSSFYASSIRVNTSSRWKWKLTPWLPYVLSRALYLSRRTREIA